MNGLNGRVLLLNASFEVLGTIGIPRAVLLVLRDDKPVTVLENAPNRFLTSAGGQKFDVPSVIVLKKYIQRKNKRRDGGSLREKIYIRDGFTCQYCSVTVGDIHPLTKKRLDRKDLTLDHINPKSKGGENTPFNLVTACKPCNNRKADRTPEMARMPLLTKELAINGLDKFLICHYAESRPEWIPYLETQEGFKQILEKKNLLEVV